MSDEQISTITEFIRKMANDWEKLSQDLPSKRALIDMLDIRITVTMT